MHGEKKSSYAGNIDYCLIIIIDSYPTFRLINESLCLMGSLVCFE